MTKNSLNHKGFTFVVLLVLFGSCSQHISLNSLLEEIDDRKHLAYYPSPTYQLKQFSSYNRQSVSSAKEGWFANNDMSHFLRIEHNNNRREFVMFDADGPGAIVRWWMTFYKAQNGIIRVYLDYDPIPVIEGAPDDMLSGDLLAEYPFSASVQEGAPIGEVGRDYDHNFYFPIPFSRHCKITYECDSLVLKYEYEGNPVEKGYYWPDVFYNICYRQYDPKIKVESFSLEALKRARPLLDTAKKALLERQADSQILQLFKQTLGPADSLKIEFEQKGHAIDMISLELRSRDKQQALRSTVISASFDGENTIWAPVGAFFGTGYTYSPHSTWMNATQPDGLMESRWIMPYKNSYQILFVNYGKDSIHLKVKVGHSDYSWKSNSMYFGTAWHQYRHIKSRDKKGAPFDLNFVDIQGKGVYAGDQITLYNNTYKWWGEGDEKIFVDGEEFPSSFGTGTEDYYGYSFGRPDPFSHPFLSQPIGTGNSDWGLVVNMRHRSLDAIPFTTSISANMELWHWANIRMNYALITYWYVKLPFEANIKPDIKSVQFPVAKSKSDFISQ